MAGIRCVAAEPPVIESESPVLALFPSSRVILVALRTGVTMLQVLRPRDVQPVLTMLPWLTVLRAVPADVAQRLVLTALPLLTVLRAVPADVAQRLVLTARLLLTLLRAVPADVAQRLVLTARLLLTLLLIASMVGVPKLVMSALPLLTGCMVEQIALREAASPPQEGAAVDWEAECLRDESQPLG